MSANPAAVTQKKKWRPYPTYKPMGTSWLKEVPAHWDVKRLRFFAAINPRLERRSFESQMEVSFLPMERIGEDGRLCLEETKRFVDVAQGHTHFHDGDIIIAKITPCFENGKGGICEGLVNGVGFGTTELHVVRANRNLNSNFLFYLTRSHPFRAFGAAWMYGVAGQQRVPEEFLKDFPTPVPGLPEQRAIATFLDRETANVDALIGKRQELITLLDEERAALISRAVTKGLDPTVPVKDSGIPSVGQVPQHWGVRRNKWVFREVDERSLSGSEELLSVSHITGVTPRSEKEVYMFLAESNEGYKVCRPNDLAINTMWAYMGAVGIVPCHGIVSPSYNVYRLRNEHEYLPQYLDYLYRTRPYVNEINRHSKGIWKSRLRLYPDSFFDMYTLTPPLPEQRSILEHISIILKSLHALRSRLEDSIVKLAEYRTALISAAVTGRIDVRGEVQ
jgi:type I restriction enzyme S subunit